MSERYVYNGTEVEMTGRVAKKDIPMRGRNTTHLSFLYEITPVDNEEGSWKKWVQMGELYEIVNNENEENNDD